MMNTQQTKLYQNIQIFSLDDPDAVLSFTHRLAKDNGWTTEYTQRVIDEYKKFTFLAVIAGHPVSPSAQVDQVWHLHLTYTHSYWDDFCGKILHKSLHHHPSRGGDSEQEKHYRWYNETLISYEKIFNERPPIDIWQPLNIQFDKNVQFKRVNTGCYWIIPKPSFSFLRLPGLKSMLIALLSFMLVLAISSFLPVIANTHNYSNHSSEIVMSQVVENTPHPDNTPTSTFENNQNTSKKASKWSWLWLFWIIFMIFGFFRSGGNSNGDDNNNNNCNSCACCP